MISYEEYVDEYNYILKVGKNPKELLDNFKKETSHWNYDIKEIDIVDGYEVILKKVN